MDCDPSVRHANWRRRASPVPFAANFPTRRRPGDKPAAEHARVAGRTTRRTRRPGRARRRISGSSNSTAPPGSRRAGVGGRVERTRAAIARPSCGNVGELAVADPVDVAQADAVGLQRLARADDDAGVVRRRARRRRAARRRRRRGRGAGRWCNAGCRRGGRARGRRHGRCRRPPRRRAAAARSCRCNGRWARSRCPGCRPCRRPPGRIRGRARAPAASASRRAGSAASPAARGWWRTGNSSGRDRGRRRDRAPARRWPSSATTT